MKIVFKLYYSSTFDLEVDLQSLVLFICFGGPSENFKVNLEPFNLHRSCAFNIEHLHLSILAEVDAMHFDWCFLLQL